MMKGDQKYCEHCGKEIDDGAAFCTNFGKQISIRPASLKSKATTNNSKTDVSQTAEPAVATPSRSAEPAIALAPPKPTSATEEDDMTSIINSIDWD